MNPALTDALQAILDGADSPCTHPLDALETLRDIATAAEALTDHVIGQALAGDWSRREIAQVLGVTRQAVEQRLARIERAAAEEQTA